jgi:hypothetical protein
MVSWKATAGSSSFSRSWSIAEYSCPVMADASIFSREAGGAKEAWR